MRRDKDDRHEDIFSCQTLLQLYAPYPRHVHVQDQTGREAQLRGVEKVQRGDKSCGGVADGFQQTDYGFDN